MILYNKINFLNLIFFNSINKKKNKNFYIFLN